MRILGIDPGSRITGYGIIEDSSRGYQYIASGCIRIQADYFPDRLKQIFDGLVEVVERYHPEQMAIEQVFMHKNADSALKLGQARGAAICAVQTAGLPVFEYAARQIKQAIVGKGSAEKTQVQHMVKILLNIQGELQIDASDALGISICHAHYQQTALRLGALR
ncbi:MAG: crossover junction endodeoxyribonuclease RuvC [Methylobacter sp.]|nr:crossover junction endodeoxyribonuclease RuvC [Methylobacter sp.]MDP2099382.1 crossover junction endodeoxyribonuclease RuvC [Methylobacter sp.]MDP2427318.1 crossover junction endodeoxyribonuclease RuvC [Methylobacter sp.]MDP3054897.1 crossover junction endodeoxyribonuclease RuvC [Methylobacter sp.]MDP3364117.1 crossover junction endodeoxyribonuclease RuvC [Methylobacter sp.]